MPADSVGIPCSMGAFRSQYRQLNMRKTVSHNLYVRGLFPGVKRRHSRLTTPQLAPCNAFEASIYTKHYRPFRSCACLLTISADSRSRKLGIRRLGYRVSGITDREPYLSVSYTKNTDPIAGLDRGNLPMLTHEACTSLLVGTGLAQYAMPLYWMWPRFLMNGTFPPIGWNCTARKRQLSACEPSKTSQALSREGPCCCFKSSCPTYLYIFSRLSALSVQSFCRLLRPRILSARMGRLFGDDVRLIKSVFTLVCVGCASPSTTAGGSWNSC